MLEGGWLVNELATDGTGEGAGSRVRRALQRIPDPRSRTHAPAAIAM
jgi:hypothetical protein